LLPWERKYISQWPFNERIDTAWRCAIPLLEEQIREYRIPSSVRDGELHLLLADLYEDDVASYRRREAAWISAVVHVVVVLLLLFAPRLLPRNSIRFIPVAPKDTTFVELPPDQLKLKAPPKTNIISDKNRIAQSRTPAPTKEALHKLIDPREPGRPNNPQPEPAPQQAEATPQVQPAPQQGTAPTPAEQPSQTAKLQAPMPVKPRVPFRIASPGSTVSEAIHSVANSRGTTSATFGGGGQYGSGLRPKVDTHGALEILSDTMGVDFGPYLQRLRQTVQEHWDPLIPPSAMPPEMKKGVVVIQFAILKDGRVAGLRVVRGSGDTPLDRAAYGAITYSDPLPRLPTNFGGDYLELRAIFYYNPDKNELE
jgi:TonB family protein